MTLRPMATGGRRDEGLAADRLVRDQSEKEAQEFGQLQPCMAVFPQERTGQVASFGPT
jgi:hypothetical protein